MSAIGRAGVVAAVVCSGALLPATAALADEPERTGWWNRLSAGGTSLPAPTTAGGDLRISQAPDGPAAYSAVLYPSFGSTQATLTLRIQGDRSIGAPDVLACVTVDAEWTEGGNQPYDTAPEYDCDLGSAFAEMAPDGSTLTFRLGASEQDRAGSWSLALVPAPGSAPFTLDVAAPEAGNFVAEPPEGSNDPITSEPFDPGFDSGSDDESPTPGEPFFPDSFDGSASDVGTSETAPLVAGGEQAALPDAAGPLPAVAGAAPGARPVVLARPAGVVEDLGTGRRLLGLLVLAGGSAAVGYAAGQQRPGPRLIGGRARVLPEAVAAGPAPSAAEDRPRGIGRFAKVRDAAPRRLR